MKKFLVLSLVLGMASMANAAVSFSIDAPATMNPGENAAVGINLDTGNLEGYDISLRIAGADDEALDATGIVFTQFGGAQSAPQVVTATATDIRVTGAAIKLFGGQPIAAPNLFVSGIDLASGANPWQDINLEVFTYAGGTRDWDAPAGENLQEGVIASAVITPEPMTMTLLGLGGLAVLRRRS